MWGIVGHLFLKAAKAVERMPGSVRLGLNILVQVGLVVLANLIAFALRFEGQVSLEYQQWGLRGLPLVVAVYSGTFFAFGIHRGLWRYAGFHDLKLILGVGVVATGALHLLLQKMLGWVVYPRSVIILTGFLSVVLLAGIRLSVRTVREWASAGQLGAIRLLIVGAGSAGEMLARDLKRNPAHEYEPVVFVDDSPVKQQRTIHGVPVDGMIEDIPSLLKRYAVEEIVVAIPRMSSVLMQRVLAASVACHLPIKTLPNVREILDGPLSMRQFRSMSLEELLQREPIQTDLHELYPLLEGKSVLVTGAGGSIGSELCWQIARYRPARLVLFERHENSVHALEIKLRESFPKVELQAVVGDITDSHGVQAVFRVFSPQLIFHAAAHKHVPLMERNEREAMRNNILGTQVVMRAACEAGVDRFVLISTDKAVNPTNVMGATKRVAEYMAQDMNLSGSTRITVVRFGNVLGSNGSVVTVFTEQIRRGGPVTVTHPDIKRYFMTIPEAVQLILQASVRGQGGDVFVLDMGEQVRIVDLAHKMIALSGLTLDRDIKITFMGLRPGEKLYEELFGQGELVESTSHSKIKRVVSNMPFAVGELSRSIAELQTALGQPDATEALKKLQALVPTYVSGRSEQSPHPQ